MPNVLYDNYFLGTQVEDKYNSHLDLVPFCTVDRTLQGTAGMKKLVNVYTATGDAEELTIGQGNSTTTEVSFLQREYDIKLAQSRFVYHDEELMKDPQGVQVGIDSLSVQLFNKTNADIFGEFNKGSRILPTTAIDFAAFTDAQAMLKLENLEKTFVFAFVSTADVAKLRKALKDDLKYVEAFAATGYIGTVAGVHIYTKKDATTGTICMATKEAVTLYVKKGAEVEATPYGSRSAADANTRTNTVFARKYYVPALTDETKDVIIMVGKTATATTDTTVQTGTTYYKADDVGYIKVTPASGDNPSTKGWYVIN